MNYPPRNDFFFLFDLMAKIKMDEKGRKWGWFIISWKVLADPSGGFLMIEQKKHIWTGRCNNNENDDCRFYIKKKYVENRRNYYYYLDDFVIVAGYTCIYLHEVYNVFFFFLLSLFNEFFLLLTHLNSQNGREKRQACIDQTKTHRVWGDEQKRWKL